MPTTGNPDSRGKERKGHRAMTVILVVYTTPLYLKARRDQERKERHHITKKEDKSRREGREQVRMKKKLLPRLRKTLHTYTLCWDLNRRHPSDH
jgi:hypothetical protein